MEVDDGSDEGLVCVCAIRCGSSPGRGGSILFLLFLILIFVFCGASAQSECACHPRSACAQALAPRRAAALDDAT